MANITFYGHSCFMVELCGVQLLFDPFITGNPLANDVDISNIRPDFILLSHGHQDHILDAETIARQSNATIVANFEIANWYIGKGIESVIPMNHGGSIDCNGVRVKMVNAVHTSSFPDGDYAGQPAGFVITGDTQSFYYSGDTALHYDMKLIGDDGGVDFAFLCLGDQFTMGINDAVTAAKFVGTKKVVGMHFDTFEPIKIDHSNALNAFSDCGIVLKLPTICKNFTID